MIHIERGRLPGGAQAVALRQDGRIVVHVSEDLSARQRAAAIREALRAAPAAGWRPEHSPVLLPALGLSAGLRQVPESRWSYRAAAAAVAGAALLITAASVTTVSVHRGAVRQPAAATGRPPLAGAGPATSQSATGDPAGGRQPGNGSSHPQPGTAPKPGRTTTTSAGGGAAGPAPEASGTPAPVPTSASSPWPQPSQAASPSPSPSPAQQSGGSGTCVDVLGVTVCL